MTAIVKKCLLATLVASGLVASSGSASAAFQLVFTPISGLPGATQQSLTFPTAPGSPSTPNTIYTGNNGTSNLAVQYGASAITYTPAGPRIQVGNFIGDVPGAPGSNQGITISYSGDNAAANILFRLDLYVDTATLPGVAGDQLELRGAFGLFGANTTISGNIAPSADIDPASLPDGALSAISITGPPIPLSASGFSSPVFTTSFARPAGSGSTVLRLTTVFDLQGYTNATVRGFAEVTLAPAVPAPAGLVLAGLGLPALGLATRLRRKVVA